MSEFLSIVFVGLLFTFIGAMSFGVLGMLVAMVLFLLLMLWLAKS